MCMLFSCTFALAAAGYTMHHVSAIGGECMDTITTPAKREQYTFIQMYTKAALFYTTTIIGCQRANVNV